jgi:plastocyanin
MKNTNKNSSILLFLTIVSALTLLNSPSYSLINDVFAQQNVSSSNQGVTLQPNINAESIFNTKTMTLGNNIKNLVILIPNEGHHAAGEDNEARFLDQHFVPENAIINTGTTVSWFNGDVGHERTINVKDTDGSTSLFNTGKITDMQLSPTYTFDKSGVYDYEAEGDPGVIMRGTITVVDNLSSLVTSSDGSTAIDTVGILMVPTQDIDKYVQEIQNAGLTVDSRHDFKDLRGGQKGTGDVQTLVVWTSAGKDLNSIIPPISELSSSLPYS